MTIELRKNIARNLQMCEINNRLENKMKQLQQGMQTPLVQDEIKRLQQQCDLNKKHMCTPISEEEQSFFDYFGGMLCTPEALQQYVNTVAAAKNPQQNAVAAQNTVQNTAENAGGFADKAKKMIKNTGTAVADAAVHFGQGTSFGLSDELNGVFGGIGRVMANGVMRVAGYPVESIEDAWLNGYREYRDGARQFLNDGYDRNPVITRTSEVAGSVLSPIKVPAKGIKGSFKTYYPGKELAGNRMINGVLSGVASGIGYTDAPNADWGNYATNIAINTGANIFSNWGGNTLFGATNKLADFDRGVMNAAVQSGLQIYDAYKRKKNNE